MGNLTLRKSHRQYSQFFLYVLVDQSYLMYLLLRLLVLVLVLPVFAVVILLWLCLPMRTSSGFSSQSYRLRTSEHLKSIAL